MDDLVNCLDTVRRRFPAAAAAVIAERRLRPAEDLWREVGALHVAFSTRQAGRIAALARQHLAAAPRSPQSLSQLIWQRLPWRESAGSQTYHQT